MARDQRPPANEQDHNVDHLVFGPGGVFCPNTKRLSGRVSVSERALYVNGKPTDYLRKAKWEKHEVTKRLAGSDVSVEAIPVIVLITDRDRIVIEAQPDDVAVVKRREIRDWLTRQLARLAPGEVARVAETRSRDLE